MPSINEALALYDTASQIDRLNFQLRSLERGPSLPHLGEVSTCVHTLATIAVSVGDQLKHQMNEGKFSGDEKKAIVGYSIVLAPLGEAMTELGRVQAEIADFNFSTHPAQRSNPSDFDHSRQQAREIITGCLGAADEILKSVVDELRTSASRLAPSPAYLHATARSPHASLVARSAPVPATPPAPASSAVPPTAARGR